MRIPKPRRKEVRDKTIIMTGGLNDIVTNLELKEGELHSCKNYMEMDSPYHGYTSVGGYEKFDGKTNPSAVAAVPIEDDGIGEDTTFLIETPTGAVDLTMNGYPVTDSGVGVQAQKTKFGDSAWRFNGTTLSVGSIIGGAYNAAYDDDFDNIALGVSTLNLSTNWTIDLQIRVDSRLSTQTIFEKKGCYKLYIDLTSKLWFQTSDNGTTYTDTIHSGDLVLGANQFYHVSIRDRDGTIQMAVEGDPCNTSGTPVTVTPASIYSNTEPVTIGADADLTEYYVGYLDEFRISSVYRWAIAFEPPTVRYSTEGYWVVLWDDVDREAQRALITTVPGIGPIRGLHVYNGELYALRDDTGGSGSTLYRANRITDGSGGYTAASGWVSVDTLTNAGGRLVAVNHRFDGWSVVASATDKRVMVYVDGKNIPRIVNPDYTVTELNSTYNGGVASTLPDNQTTAEYATHVAIYDNRVVLAYEKKQLAMGSSADPGDFSGGFGANFLVGDEVTNLKTMPKDALAIICRNSIKIITKLDGDQTAVGADFWFRMDDYTEGESGGKPFTAQRILDRMLYADDRGIIDMMDTDKYADFSQAAVSKKVNRVYLAKKSLTTTAMVAKDVNQYRIFFSDGSALYFTFIDDKLKGATYIQFPIDVNIVASGEDPSGDIVKFFAPSEVDDNGNAYVYQMDSGTSFDGEEIDTEMFTSFYNYGSSRRWKDFQRIVLEATANRGTVLNIRGVFDYDDAEFPETLWFNRVSRGVGGIWDEDNWGTFAWSEGVVSRIVHYLRGYGTNMSIEIRTSNKYTDQHVIHNAIVDYTVGDKKQ